jgi:1,4-dihydroxy-2-naphthoate octaprenyltransferase
MDVETHNPETNKTKAWLNAMRLRTLPLALASTFSGSFLALEKGFFDGWILALTAITTILLQVNSNLANDYGDFEHGTDNDDRIGPERALQSGILQSGEMRKAIILFSVLSLFSGVALLYMAPLELWLKGVLFAFGVAAIYASIKYTAGSNPYGYRGLGDISVMAFFGILGVVGAYVCQAGSLEWSILLPAFSIGAFSTGVLNVNNTRDIDSDTKAGKITLAVKMGPVRARNYHVLLIVIGLLLILGYAIIEFSWGWKWLFLLAFPLLILNAVKVKTTLEASKLDPYLKQLALSTFFLSVLIAIGVLL